MKIPFFDLKARQERMDANGVKAFRIKQIEHEIFQNSIIDFHEMSALPKELRVQLDEMFCIIPFEVDGIYEGKESCKVGFRMSDDTIIESVLMFHYHNKDKTKPKGKWAQELNRLTLCISTQVGCPVGCIFCVTGKLWFGKNLSLAEVLGQIIWTNNWIKHKFGVKEDGTNWAVRNIVFMGMGEPLLNYEVMKQSIWYMLDNKTGWGLSRRHVTISTSGIVPGIRRLIEDGINVRLALSLHAPNQPLREILIPTISKVYTLDKLMAAIDDYVVATDNRIFYEYIMIKDMTDSVALAHQLVDLLKDRLAHVNLIPYNPNPAMPDLEESERSVILRFRDILEAGGITVTTRDNHARDEKGACGQLGYEKVSKGEKITRIK
jgi:23S rRNA (adenine2503-C2)-methyltransferase